MNIIFLSHGSRNRDNNVDFKNLISMINVEPIDKLYTISFTYLSFAEPSFKKTLMKLSKKNDKILVIPLFLFNATHVKNDIPEIIGQCKLQNPSAKIELYKIDGIFYQCMVNYINNKYIEKNNRYTLIIVGRGSSDSDSVKYFNQFIHNLNFDNSIEKVYTAFCNISEPTVYDIFNTASAKGAKKIIVFPFILFKGKLYNDIKDSMTRFLEINSQVEIELLSPIAYKANLPNLIKEELVKLA